MSTARMALIGDLQLVRSAIHDVRSKAESVERLALDGKYGDVSRETLDLLYANRASLLAIAAQIGAHIASLV